MGVSRAIKGWAMRAWGNIIEGYGSSKRNAWSIRVTFASLQWWCDYRDLMEECTRQTRLLVYCVFLLTGSGMSYISHVSFFFLEHIIAILGETLRELWGECCIQACLNIQRPWMSLAKHNYNKTRRIAHPFNDHMTIEIKWNDVIKNSPGW